MARSWFVFARKNFFFVCYHRNN